MGRSNSDHLRAQAVRDMAEQAEHIIVLTESEKFNSHGVVPLQLKERIDTIITDDHIPEDIQTHLPTYWNCWLGTYIPWSFYAFRYGEARTRLYQYA